MLKVVSSALCVLGLTHHEETLFSLRVALRGYLYSIGGIGSYMWYRLLNIQHQRGSSQIYVCFMLAKFKVSISSDPSSSLSLFCGHLHLYFGLDLCFTDRNRHRAANLSTIIRFQSARPRHFLAISKTPPPSPPLMVRVKG